jgi:predicted TIM-barrel fold metal-dependent hydrolase
MRIDVHAHCYPKPYMEELKKFGLAEEGGVGVDIPAWEDAAERIAAMDAVGIDMQVLTLSAPGVYFDDSGLSRALAQMTNDFIAEVARKHPDRFLSVASVPLNDPDTGLSEMERAIDHLGMDGVVVGTNVNQRSLSDDSFLPFFEEVNRRAVPVVLHPLRAIGQDMLPAEDVRLAVPTNVGFIFETTRTIAQLTFKGIFERYPKVTFVLPHSGGAIPFIYPRWDIFTRSRPAGHALKRLPHLPSYYLKRHYYDTALAYHPSTIRCTLDLAGIDHLVLGTDFPYTNDFRGKETIESIETYGFTDEDKRKVYAGNVASLFPKLRERAVKSQ